MEPEQASTQPFIHLPCPYWMSSFWPLSSHPHHFHLPTHGIVQTTGVAILQPMSIVRAEGFELRTSLLEIL